jgi:hypothetical protein
VFHKILRNCRCSSGGQISGTGEEASRCTGKSSHAPPSVSRRPELEEDIDVLARLLIPARGVRLNLNPQIRIAKKKFLEKRTEDIPGHGDGTSNLEDSART